MKTLPAILTVTALSAAAVAAPAAPAWAVNGSPTITASCQRGTALLGDPVSPSLVLGSDDVALDPALPTTITVVFTDASTLSGEQPAGSDQLHATLTGLGSTRIPARVRLDQSGSSVTVPFASLSTCDAAVAAPMVVQHVVAGPGNDTFTLTLPNGRILTEKDAAWSDGHSRLSFTVQPWQNGPHWFAVGDQVGNAPSYLLTDDGGPASEQVPEMRTITVPTYSNRSTCTDPLVGTFQVDAYRPATAAQLATVRANSARNTLPYRFDGPNAPRLANSYRRGSYASLWGHSSVEFVTIHRSQVVHSGSLAAAINASTTRVPDLGGRLALNRTWTTAWKLAPGATADAPWTATPSTAASKAQAEYETVHVPAAVCTQTRVQTGTRTVSVPTGRMTTRARPDLLVAASSVITSIYT